MYSLLFHRKKNLVSFKVFVALPKSKCYKSKSLSVINASYIKHEVSVFTEWQNDAESKDIFRVNM